MTSIQNMTIEQTPMRMFKDASQDSLGSLDFNTNNNSARVKLPEIRSQS